MSALDCSFIFVPDLSRSAAAGEAGEPADEVGASFDAQLFGHDAQGAVGGDEVHRLHALVAADGEQEVLEKDGAAGAGGRDRQVLRRMVHPAQEHREWCGGSQGGQEDREVAETLAPLEKTRGFGMTPSLMVAKS